MALSLGRWQHISVSVRYSAASLGSLRRRLSQEAEGINTTHGAREYFHFQVVLRGLRKILKSSFGVDMQDVPLAPGTSCPLVGPAPADED